MSDEFRDLLKGRAHEVQVPASDLGDVIRGGNARKWRNRAYSVSVIVLVAVVGWATVPGIIDSLRNEGRSPNIADTPTPAPTQTFRIDTCQTVPFRPTYLPDGWSYEMQPSDTQYSLGRYTTIDGEGGSVEVFPYERYYRVNPGEGDPIEVLGEDGQSGTIHEGGLVVEFTYHDCAYSLSTYTESERELRMIAEGLQPLITCRPGTVGGRTMNLGDGRFFGYIRALDMRAVEFDVAEWLSGEEANSAAAAAGDIQPGETVPNDYYIVNEDKETGRFPLTDDVKVIIDTIQDGFPGPAPADLEWLICEFGGERPQDPVSHRLSGYWLTVKDGLVTEIEEQYVP